MDPTVMRTKRAIVLVAIAAVVVAYGLDGGAYDPVVRGEFGLALWWMIGIAGLAGVLSGARPARSWWIVLAAGLAFLALNVIALTSTASDERTVLEVTRVLHHLGVVLAVALVVRRETVVAAVGGLLAGTVVVAAVAVASRLAPSAFPVDVVRATFGLTRLSYPLDYWNATGAWGAMGAMLALALGSHLRRAAPRAIALAPAPLLLVSAYLAYSRAAAVGVVAGTLALVALSRHRGTAALHVLGAILTALPAVLVIRAHVAIADGTGGRGGVVVALVLLAGMLAMAGIALLTLGVRADDRLRMPRRTFRIAVALAVAVVAVLGVTIVPGVASSAWDSFNEGTAKGPADPAQRLGNLNGNRHNIYASAIEAGRTHALAGVGPGTFEFWWNTDARDDEPLRDAHSLYLEQFAELGWPGLFAVVWFVLALLGGGVLARRRAARDDPAVAGAVTGALAAFVIFAVQAGVDWMWESTAVAVVGLACGACALAAGTERLPRRPRRRWRIVLPAVALLAVAVQLPPTVSLSRVRASQRAAARGDAEAARTAAQEALDAEPWAATPYVQRGLLREAAGDLGAATDDLLRAQRSEPTNWRHPLVLARLLAEQGEARPAIAAYRRARSLRPLSPRLQP